MPRIGRPVDGQPAPSFAVFDPQSADPRDHGGDVVRPVPGRDVGAEADERMAARIALAVPGPAFADGDLELDHRLQPVDIRTLEQARLDQSHGPGRIASRHEPDTGKTFSRLAVEEALVTSIASDPELDALRTVIASDLPAYLADLETLVNIDCGSYTPAGVDEVGAWTGRFLEGLGATVEHRPDPDGRYGTTPGSPFVIRAPVSRDCSGSTASGCWPFPP